MPKGLARELYSVCTCPYMKPSEASQGIRKGQARDRKGRARDVTGSSTVWNLLHEWYLLSRLLTIATNEDFHFLNCSFNSVVWFFARGISIVTPGVQTSVIISLVRQATFVGLSNMQYNSNILQTCFLGNFWGISFQVKLNPMNIKSFLNEPDGPSLGSSSY